MTIDSRTLIIFLYHLIIPFYTVYAQSNVKISRDIGIRTEYSYEILPNFAGRNLLFRDRGKEFFIDVFDEDLEYIRTDDIVFDTRRVSVNKVLVKDSLLYVFHTFYKKDSTLLAVRYYNTGLELMKSDTLLRYKSEEFDINFREIMSFDESKLALFQIVKSSFLCIVVDIKGYDSHIVSSIKSNFRDRGSRESFRGLRVTNKGNYFIVFESGNDWDKPKGHYFSLFYNQGGTEFLESVIEVPKVLSSGVRINFDDANQRFGLAGLYGSRRVEDVEGIYFFNKSIAAIGPKEEVQLVPVDKKVVEELYGRSKAKKPIIRDHMIKLLRHRSDGGLIIVTEMQKEFVRRGGTFPVAGAPMAFGGNNLGQTMSRNLVDHYNEDLIVFSLNKDGGVDWRKVLFKKQFSQDDDGAFSSFFYFSTDKRLRLIFNDEIKASNTVSEYVLDPSGRYERNAVLNTDYKDLKLRFRDAVQISSSEFIVPSERNYKLALVKLKI
ncbi:MAG TPA: hypothetical protein PKD85_02390 [Saprospiraceae bacterium]|nr:hypothetical protein [Saprospiraceae bacterium]